MNRSQWSFGLLAGMITGLTMITGAPREASAQVVLSPITVTSPEEISWDQAVRNFREQNKLVGTVIIGAERWTPERQAAEPSAFRAALAEAQSRVASPRYQAASRAEMDRVNEAQKQYRERRLEEIMLDRQERLAHLNFDWQRISGWQLAANAVPVRIAELEATATANALSLQSTRVNVTQSPGVAVAQPTSLDITPEIKARAVRRFLTGGESLTKIAYESNVPPQLVHRWVQEILK